MTTAELLGTVGLPDPCGTVYAVLVAHPGATVAELAELTELSAARVRQALNRLAANGLASSTRGRTPTWLAAAPDVAIGGLVGHAEDELLRVKSLMHELTDSYRKSARFTRPDLSVEVIRGSKEIGRRVNQLQAEARDQIRAFDRPPYLEPPGSNLSRAEQLAHAGLRFRIVYARDALSWPGRVAGDILLARGFGEEARVRPDLPAKLVICDDRQALIPFSHPDEHLAAAYVIHPSSLLDVLIGLFEAEWKLALPLQGRPAAGEGPRDAPDETARTLLLLLASGHTDEAIARSLGWSFRTTQRRVRALMRSLDATTRFQAGMAARGRGWI
ncbi:winged helix-turn-helix transcriptional regulator [Kitasatospora sp. NPDC088134]|uniref:winged helix-turn-helix transcriptional regulator n=1 Tax=Kitasatospora sp. NPDC088134 TaxID=3364071 RepID=UPI003814FCA1